MAEPVLENNEIKRRAIRRLIVAVVLVLVAVGILTYLSYYKPAKVVTKPAAETLAPPPPPIVTGPEPQIVEPAQVPSPLPELPPIEATAPALAPEAKPLPAAPPPPSVSTKPLPPPGPGPKKLGPEPLKPLIKAEPVKEPIKPTPPTAPSKPGPTPPQAPSAAPKPAPAPSGYVVQFGVFSNPLNAQQLVERLKQIGIDAQTETRVQLPPFKTKAEAEAALAKMKEKGLNATMIGR